ncbi:TonB-dependent siderophore receptor [Nevskia sp.]|uniref:TonB-dependent siderophore receptor n=1 Tax=Nevskia sp. TaxID=1929292 RepID=UPI003F7231BD
MTASANTLPRGGSLRRVGCIGVIGLQLLAAEPARADASQPAVQLDPVQVRAERPAAYAAETSVSATRSDTPLDEIPQSVQVITRTLIDDQQLHQLNEALANVSGVFAPRPEDAILVSPIVRGFAAEVYVDGLPAFGTTSTVDPGALAGIQQIEVIKGPSGSLFGGGVGAPLGGIINLVTRSPVARAGGEIGVRAGSFATINPFFDVNQPLFNGVAVRLSGEYQRAYADIDAVQSQRYALFPAIAVGLGGPTTLTLRGQFSRQAYLEYSGLPSALTLSDRPYVREHFSGATTTPHTVVLNQGGALNLRHSFGDGLEAVLDARLYRSRFDEYGSFTFPAFFPPGLLNPTAYPVLSGYLPSAVRETTVDGRVVCTLNGKRVENRVIVGAQYDRTRYEAGLGLRLLPNGRVDYADPDSDVPFGAVPPVSDTQADRFVTGALYLQDQLSLFDRVHLLAGLRWERLALDRPANGFDRDQYRLSPRGGLVVELVDGVSLFGGYAQGFRGVTLLRSDAPVQPETSRSAEAGFKLAARELGLSGTLAVYELRRRNVPTPAGTLLDPSAQTQTGEQRARGIESDLIWEPVRALSLLTAYAYTDAVVSKDNALPVGNRLPRIAKHSGRLAVRYRLLDGLGVGVGVSAGSRRQVTLPNVDSVPGAYVVDAQASWTRPGYEFGLSVSNLTGRQYLEPYPYLAQSVTRPATGRALYATAIVRY